MAKQLDNSQRDHNGAKKSAGSALVINMTTFVAMGVVFGVAFNNIPVGICLGCIFGAAVGIIKAVSG